MASRPAWTVKNGKVNCAYFEFSWNGGFAVVQKQKNISALHEQIQIKYGEKALEVSSKSTEALGRQIGAFHLKRKGVYIENIFQAAKKYENGGPFLDMLEMMPKEAKRDERHHNSGKLVSFVLEDVEWPLEPMTAFYDYIYIMALKEHYGETLDLGEYHWFTDIEFNPKKSVNCQARSAAIYQLLREMKCFDRVEDMQNWIAFHRTYVCG
ncbi:MAG: hypothetical protein HFH82_01185 [Lachnospiraceae bacterium]|nr:hypothetical protein [Lachnospiraceae bacterium]